MPARTSASGSATARRCSRPTSRRKRPLIVGLFADQSIEEVNEIALEAEVDLVQLSGDEAWDDCLLVARQVIQVVHVSPLDSPSDPLKFVEPGFAIALMLDSAHGPYRGGSGARSTGRSPAWSPPSCR